MTAGSGQVKPKSGLAVWAEAIVGKRTNQEDNYHVEYLPAHELWLLVVCDGMGGHAAGAIASDLACKTMRDAVADALDEGLERRTALACGLDAANRAIAAYQKEVLAARGMGTTLVGALLDDTAVHWISVGDSPLWLLRRSRLLRLNDDHSLRAVAAEFPVNGNVLQSAVSGGEIAMVDCPAQPQALQPGDIVVAASDGILTLEEDEIARIVAAHRRRSPRDAVRALLTAVISSAHTTQDNCSIVVAAVGRRFGIAGTIRECLARLGLMGQAASR